MTDTICENCAKLNSFEAFDVCLNSGEIEEHRRCVSCAYEEYFNCDADPQDWEPVMGWKWK